MGEVHELIATHGKKAALLSSPDRQAVEVAAAYMADEEAGGIGFLYSGWCQAALPHRRLPDSEVWQVQSERVTLIVQPGMRPTVNGAPVPVGVPYGSRARLIMLYLQTEALRTRSRDIGFRKWGSHREERVSPVSARRQSGLADVFSVSTSAPQIYMD
jgi:hypothetical protein